VKARIVKAAKARGKRLGNPKLFCARRPAALARKERADRYSANVLPVIPEIQRSGIGITARHCKSISSARCSDASRRRMEPGASERNLLACDMRHPSWKSPLVTGLLRSSEEGGFWVHCQRT
jgi:hypothetical protein